MARYQLWDNPSASLLEESDDLDEVTETIRHLIDEEGLDILQELSLSEELDGSTRHLRLDSVDARHLIEYS